MVWKFDDYKDNIALTDEWGKQVMLSFIEKGDEKGYLVAAEVMKWFLY